MKSSHSASISLSYEIQCVQNYEIVHVKETIKAESQIEKFYIL